MNVLDFASQISQSGLRFYLDMSALSRLAGIKKIFSKLASDEIKLLGFIRKLKDENTSYIKYDSSTLNDQGNIFKRLIREEEALHPGDDIEAYRLALEAEQSIVDGYEKAIRTEKNPEVKELLQKIAGEEKHELEEIEGAFNFVNAPNEYLEWGEFSNLGEFHNFGRDVDQS
ncbi:MAG: hypothetical protein C0615_11565 [Desulfuromonas sp.]|nr:MAG: hypothetical protein C0615_11565 [Desulfuromonas sp.]